MKKLLNKFMLGADPEFVVFNKDRWVRIKLPPPLEGVGNIGEDHGGRVFELHPIQTRGAYGLVRRMQRLFPTMKEWDSNEYRFKSGAIAKSDTGTDSLGGHVHFGISMAELKADTGTRYTALLKQLDKFTHCLENLDILPQNESLHRRKIGNYGLWSDVRESGRDRHIEYRTMASWLLSPELAFLCLTGAKLIAFNPQGDVPTPVTISKTKLAEFFVQYKEDANAARVIEVVLPGLPKTDPDIDIRTSWNKPLNF